MAREDAQKRVQGKESKGRVMIGDKGKGKVTMPVAPVAYQVILEPGISQFREFEPPRVHTRINSWALFLVHTLTCGKRESVS